jgi:hypothetical protein
MSKHWSIVLLAGVAAALVVAGFSPGASDEKQALAKGDFKGKAVIVTVKADSRPTVLINVRVRLLGQREFLVGKVLGNLDDAKDKRKGAIIWLPVEDIRQVAEYASLDNLNTATEHSFSDE